jgi:ABC-type antimicrobial peptide transport system permease subunit
MQTMQDEIDLNLDQQRTVAQMTGLFGILALVLAAVGLYGVTAYAVERRTGEIGVRMALGANRSDVMRLVLRGAFLQILIGLAIGIPVAIGCSRLIAAQLYEVKGWDPLVLAGAILTLVTCAFFASIIPARRAASIQPGASLANRIIEPEVAHSCLPVAIAGLHSHLSSDCGGNASCAPL